jgi:hypothetical protein
MCRNIKTLANFEPPATDEEIRASAQRLIRALTTTAPPRNREVEAQKAQERARQRYA